MCQQAFRHYILLVSLVCLIKFMYLTVISALDENISIPTSDILPHHLKLTMLWLNSGNCLVVSRSDRRFRSLSLCSDLGVQTLTVTAWDSEKDQTFSVPEMAEYTLTFIKSMELFQRWTGISQIQILRFSPWAVLFFYLFCFICLYCWLSTE